MDERSNGRWTNSEAIMRNWEEKNDQSIYKWVRTQEDFYDELLLISSTANENILFKGLNHYNEAVRYWAGQGFTIWIKNKKGYYQLLNQKLNDSLSMLVLVLPGHYSSMNHTQRN